MEKYFPAVDRLNAVIHYLKSMFVGKDDILDLMGICLTGRENLFLLGPPGTAKSAMVRELSKLIEGKSFEYLLTRFTEPNELFGPFDIRKLREGELLTNTDGMLPEANLIFLDELLNANSAILNSLLMVLNERVFRRGKETRPLPALLMVGASNHLPQDEALQALFDRFLIRVQCSNVDPEHLGAVLNAGWKLEQNAAEEKPTITSEEIRSLQKGATMVSLEDLRPAYMEMIQKLRNAGVQVSDRRAVKLQRMVAASAMLCKRCEAVPSDLWVMRYIWDTDEQREVIAGIVDSVVEPATEAKESNTVHHPRASRSTAPNADELYQEALKLSENWAKPETTLSEKAVIKDRLRYLSGRCEWISNADQRAFVLKPIEALWKAVLQET